jgi:hypothetical protein
MKKDVIYIDVEDDITAIIGKIKASSSKLVALVPPKRTGVLQSAVNLRLLARAAENGDKKLVLVTGNQALASLAGNASIPVAKNLQSKPEIVESPEADSDPDDDVIEGSSLPVGQIAKATDKGKKEEDIEDAMETIDIDSDAKVGTKVSLSDKSTKKANKPKKASRIPDFSKFRKKLFIGAGASVVLILLLVWALVFAPAAKVIITARTEPAPVSLTVELGGTRATNVEEGLIQTVSKQVSDDASVEFKATGERNVGDKATGTIEVRNCDYQDGFTLPAGTEFTRSGSSQVFENASAVTVPGYKTVAASLCDLEDDDEAGVASVNVTAVQSGTSYNVSSGSYSVGSIPNGSDVSAQGTAMTGGTTEIVNVVTAGDVQKASEELVSAEDDAFRQQLVEQFSTDEFIIDDSFEVNRAEAESAPGVGSVAEDGNATLTSATTYSMTAISRAELTAYVEKSLEKQIDKDTQRVYDNGLDDVEISGYVLTDEVATVNISTVGRIGPTIDEEDVVNQSIGKRYGEIQSTLEALDGVVGVDIEFSYPWVWTVPDDKEKVDVEFKIEDE